MNDPTKSQSERMEGELAALRELFEEARINQNASQMISLSRVIIQHEKEISKQRLHEGVTLERDSLTRMVDQACEACVRVGRRTLPKDMYDRFVDDLIAELSVLWNES